MSCWDACVTVSGKEALVLASLMSDVRILSVGWKGSKIEVVVTFE
jgi:hypothetical protein